jgi:hypothetical protein
VDRFDALDGEKRWRRVDDGLPRDPLKGRLRCAMREGERRPAPRSQLAAIRPVGVDPDGPESDGPAPMGMDDRGGSAQSRPRSGYRALPFALNLTNEQPLIRGDSVTMMSKGAAADAALVRARAAAAAAPPPPGGGGIKTLRPGKASTVPPVIRRFFSMEDDFGGLCDRFSASHGRSSQAQHVLMQRKCNRFMQLGVIDFGGLLFREVRGVGARTLREYYFPERIVRDAGRDRLEMAPAKMLHMHCPISGVFNSSPTMLLRDRAEGAPGRESRSRARTRLRSRSANVFPELTAKLPRVGCPSRHASREWDH